MKFAVPESEQWDNPRPIVETRRLEEGLQAAELHLLDYEWYFTQESALRVARLLEPTEALFLGAPTVAISWAASGGSNGVLVDRNRLLTTRWLDWPVGLGFFPQDLRANLAVSPRSFAGAFFDSPWYLRPTLRWLQQASRAVVREGLIAFVLFPELVRPAALLERQRVLSFASTLGPLDIVPNALEYTTPLFEVEARGAAGVSGHNRARRGDLVILRNRWPYEGSPNREAPPSAKWDTYRLGRQVVKLRRQSAGRTDATLSAVEGCEGWILPSVSARDLRRPRIDLWTSRNRVAQVGDRARVAHALSHLTTLGTDARHAMLHKRDGFSRCLRELLT